MLSFHRGATECQTIPMQTLKKQKHRKDKEGQSKYKKVSIRKDRVSRKTRRSMTCD